ncbi:hypothetical protein OAG71_00570 [bacterium]|nr:hypothetical protein [bacterium]
MYQRKHTIAEYSKHLPNCDAFTCGEALSALQLFFSSECDECSDDADGLVFLTGVFKDDSSNFQIVLSRICELFSQLTVSLQFKVGIRSFLIPKTHVASTERNESPQFFSEAAATRAFWLYRNVKPLKCSITYVDADDRGDEFYHRFSEFAGQT